MDDRRARLSSAVAQGLRAARANLAPGAVLWAVGIAILLGYYLHPPTRAALEQLAEFRTRWGVLFSIVSTATVGGLIPVLIQQLMPRLPDRAQLCHLPFYLGFWALKGIETDLLYRGQAALFGDRADVPTIAAKSFVDQFILVPLWFVPVMVIFYTWKESGFRVGEVGRRLGRHPYRDRCVPVMLSNWGVWIPAVILIYALPLPLQLPIQNVVLCIWVLMLMFITARHGHPDGANAVAHPDHTA